MKWALPATCQGEGPRSEATSWTPSSSTSKAETVSQAAMPIVNPKGANSISASKLVPPSAVNPTRLAQNEASAPNCTVLEVSAK